jgi:putative DNA primase/helicase
VARQLDALKRALASEFPEVLHRWFPEGVLEGGVFRIGSTGGERGNSLKVNRNGQWKDWANGDFGSNLLELYAQHHRLDIVAAYDDLAPHYGLNGSTPAPVRERRADPPKPKEPPKPKHQLEIPAPEGVGPLRWRDEKVSVFEYRDFDGRLLYFTYRREPDEPSGKKDFKGFTYGTHGETGERKWIATHPPAPRPLYNLPALAASPDRTVILVSGEKCVEALQPLLTEGNWRFPVLTWAGGDQSIGKADWSPLAGKTVWYWPDEDEPRLERGKWVASGPDTIPVMGAALTAIGCKVKILRISPELLEQLPADKRDGADVADVIAAGMNIKDVLRAMVKAGQYWAPPAPEPEPTPEPPPPQEPPAEPAPEPPPAEPAPEPPPAAQLPPDAASTGLPVPLGMQENRIVLLDRRGPAIERFARADMGKRALQFMADKEDWERSKYGHPGRGEALVIDWERAADEYVAACLAQGQMATDRVLGIGVWEDRGRIVANLAREGLVVDGQLVPIAGIESAHSYIANGRPVPMVDPMPLSEALDVCDMVCSLRWEDPFYGVALAGWLATAPIVGTLPWRPNLWITGQSGSGKSFVLNHIVKPLILPVGLYVQGHTTEAGVRQTIAGKAVPVVWDEFEIESRGDSERRKAVMELIRNSTQGRTGIRKGAAGGHGGVTHLVVASWLLASVNTQQTQRADIRRTLTIELSPQSKDEARRAKEAAQFAELERRLRKWDDAIGLRWTWRSVRMAKAISVSRELMIDQMLARDVARATADQIAGLLAGYCSLLHDRPVTAAEAERLLDETYFRWLAAGSPEATAADDVTDEAELLNSMLDHQVTVTVEEGDRPVTRRVTLRELVALAVVLPHGEANKALARFGLRISGKWLLVADSHPELRKLMSDTPWQSWKQILRRIDGARPADPRYYGTRTQVRGTQIPLEACGISPVE